MERIWENFSRIFTIRAQAILKGKGNFGIIWAKTLNYNTFRLGVDGYSVSLIAKPIDFHIFITDLGSEIDVTEEQKEKLETLWKSLEIQSRSKQPVLTSLKERYLYFGYGRYAQSLCLTAEFIYDWYASKWSEKALEAFAGYYNHRLENWCSLFEDLEIPLGSKGSFFRLGDRINQYDLIISNPPYQNPILNLTSEVLSTFSGNSISIIPDWRSAEEDISEDIILKEPTVHPSRRWSVPYPAFEILKQSKTFQGVLYAYRLNFMNDLASKNGGFRMPEVPILIVVLGSPKLWSSLVNYFQVR